MYIHIWLWLLNILNCLSIYLSDYLVCTVEKKKLKNTNIYIYICMNQLVCWFIFHFLLFYDFLVVFSLFFFFCFNWLKCNNYCWLLLHLWVPVPVPMSMPVSLKPLWFRLATVWGVSGFKTNYTDLIVAWMFRHFQITTANFR